MELSGTTFCITGFSGYVGRHLVQDLTSRGLRPFLIGRPGTDLPDMPGVAIARRWSTPTDLAAQLCALDNPVILNLAGHFVKAHTPGDLGDIVDGNLTYPAQIFEAVALSGTERLVNVGTSWEYSDRGIPEPLNLYAAIKKSNAMVLDWYAAQHPIRAINLKLNDTYGGDDTRPKLMPLLKKHALTGEPVQLGYSSQLLNLTFIDDVIRAILWAAQLTVDQQTGTVEEAFLLGGETQSIGEIVDLIQTVTGKPLNVQFRGIAPEHHTLRGIWSGAPHLRDWRAKTDLRTGLKTYFDSEV